MKPSLRERLGRYRLLGVLGKGGMGEIHLACSRGPMGFEKLCALKMLHARLQGDAKSAEAFLDEARLSLALNHPNIVHTFDVGRVDGALYMAMEFIEGQSLAAVWHRTRKHGAPPITLIAFIFSKALEGLHAAHLATDDAGRPLHAIHRDVSPRNILLSYDGIPKILDFGVAKARGSTSVTEVGFVKGNYAYMSPEQIREEPLDTRSDQFSAAIVLWELLAGRRLFLGASMLETVERIVTEQPLSPIYANPACDPLIAEIVLKALQKDRRKRFASVWDFKEALDDAIRPHRLRPRESDIRAFMHRLFHREISEQRDMVMRRLVAERARQPNPMIAA